MPSETSFLSEAASISFGFFVESSLTVPATEVASSAKPGKRKVFPLMTIVVCFTSSSGKAIPSSIAETTFHVPCNRSRSFMVLERLDSCVGRLKTEPQQESERFSAGREDSHV